MRHLVLGLVLLASSYAQADICGDTDDRVPHNDSKVARFTTGDDAVGCTMTMISESCGVTASICDDHTVAEFNVPAANDGQPSFSALEDIYEVEKLVGSSNAGIGSTWAVVKLRPNAVTGKHAGATQGFYAIEKNKSAVGSSIRVAGYSAADNNRYDVTSGAIPPNSFAAVINRSQSVSQGKLIKSGIFLLPEIIEYTADTWAGSAGAAVINNNTNSIVGIVTHGGCNAKYAVKLGARYTNSGTSITGNKEFKKAIAACMKN